MQVGEVLDVIGVIGLAVSVALYRPCRLFVGCSLVAAGFVGVFAAAMMASESGAGLIALAGLGGVAAGMALVLAGLHLPGRPTRFAQRSRPTGS